MLRVTRFAAGAVLAFSALAAAASPASRLILAGSKRIGVPASGLSCRAAAAMSQHPGPHAGWASAGESLPREAPPAAAAATAAAASSASFAARFKASMWVLDRGCGFLFTASSPSFTPGRTCPQPCRLQS